MTTISLSRRRALACGLSISFAAPAAWADPPIEQVVGGIEAIVFVCSPVDAKSAKAGQELLQKTVAQRKLDLAAVRKTDGYKSIYNSEVNRLLALPPGERAATCKSAW
jgi:hypothetical protein